MIDVDKLYRIVRARNLLPLSCGTVDRGSESSLGAHLKFPAPIASLPQPAPLCFENRWQPDISPSVCEQPLVVKSLYAPVANEARIVGDGVVLTRDDSILAESVGRHAGRNGLEEEADGGYRLSKKLRLQAHRARKREVPRHDVTAMALFDPAIRGFGMWLIKCLPKLGLAPLLQEPNLHLIVPLHVPDLYLTLLQDLGFPSSRLLFHDPAGLSVVRKLIVPPKMYTFTASRYGNPFTVFDYVGRRASNLVLPSLAQSRVYITRRGNPRRVLVNERAVEEIFREAGFHVLNPGRLTAAERLSIFAGCRFVAGAQGSGLYNILFSRRAPRALALVPPVCKFENAFLTIGHICVGKGGNAGYIFGRMLDDNRGAAGEFSYTWEIDTGQLRDTLARLV